MAFYFHCQECGRQLRDAFFCHRCGRSMCSWHCLEKHATRHAAVPLSRPVGVKEATPNQDRVPADAGS
jgi:hypothetical protein